VVAEQGESVGDLMCLAAISENTPHPDDNGSDQNDEPKN
jgi:hypothetical protein